MCPIQIELNALIESQMSREQMIAQKMRIAVLRSDTDESFKTDCLKDVPLGLMPKVLHLLQQENPSTATSFKNVWHVMKSCVVPFI